VASNHATVSSTVEEGQRILRTSRRLAIVLGISGASIAAALVAYASWFGDTAGSRRAESAAQARI